MTNGEVPLTTDNTPKQRGIVSVEYKNWAMIAVALVVVVLICVSKMTGPAPAKLTARDTATGQPIRPATPDDARRYGAELAKQTADLEQQRTRAEAMQAQAEKAAAGAVSPVGSPQVGVPVQQGQVYAQPTQSVEKKKESSIVLSFREGAAKTQPTDIQSDLKDLIETQKAAIAGTLKSLPQQEPVEAKPVTKPAEAEQQQVTGKRYKLFEGTLIESVLVNRLNGSFTGPVIVLVRSNVYSHNDEHILIPQGTRVLGEAKAVGTQGQRRLAVVFHRMVMPDGYSVSLDDFVGLNQVGETGLKDRTNNHWGQIFGTSIALGLVSGFSAAGTGNALTSSGIGQYRQGVAASIGQSSTQVLDSKLNILPEITIREGHRVGVYLQKDLELPAYEDHKMKGDL